MGLWPFGRDPANVEIASRVVTACAADDVKVRGKLTIHFAEPQTQTAADLTADRCAAVIEMVLREHRRHEEVLGSEADMVLKLLDRLPPDIAPARTIELASLHVVGDLGSHVRRRASNTSIPPSSVAPPLSSVASPLSSVIPPPLSSAPPPLSSAPARRRSSHRMRVMAASMMLPVGSPPQAIGAALAPLLRDSTLRLLIGFLRIHDLVEVRGVALEEGSQDLQVAVSTILGPPQGELAASRAAEVARWQGALGVGVVEALHREAGLVSVHQTFAALLHVEVPRSLAIELLEEFCARAFPGERSPFVDIRRYLDTDGVSLSAAVALRITQIVGGEHDPALMIATLTPLLASVEEDIAVAATLAKHSLGI